MHGGRIKPPRDSHCSPQAIRQPLPLILLKQPLLIEILIPITLYRYRLSVLSIKIARRKQVKSTNLGAKSGKKDANIDDPIGRIYLIEIQYHANVFQLLD